MVAVGQLGGLISRAIKCLCPAEENTPYLDTNPANEDCKYTVLRHLKKVCLRGLQLVLEEYLITSISYLLRIHYLSIIG